MENILSPYQNIAQIYDAIRPEYPRELLDNIICETGICPGQRILELGAGTGKATKAFLDRGICVDAVELEKNMAQILREKSDSDALQIYVSSFEDWDSKERYPLVVSAQAFHCAVDIAAFTLEQRKAGCVLFKVGCPHCRKAFLQQLIAALKQWKPA